MKKAFIFNHLYSYHSELVSGSATYQNWRKLPPPKGEGWGEGSTSVYKAFTLAEVLITLAIIGVVAAISIPSVISNAQQQEFKTGLRKAVSVLNSAITMNIALDGESPYDNGDLFRYLQKHMSIMKSTTRIPYGYAIKNANNELIWWRDKQDSSSHTDNAAFYTTDGMRFEFHWNNNTSVQNSESRSFGTRNGLTPYEGGFGVQIHTTVSNPALHKRFGCGSYGLSTNINGTTNAPCIIMVDVNGDRKPFPANALSDRYADNTIVLPNANAKKVSDIFTILITEDRAVPFGVVAQRAMYQAQK